MSDTRPSNRVLEITPSDTELLTPQSGAFARAIYVGVLGDLTVKFSGAGTPVTFTAVPAGTWLPIRPEFVMDTDTTAENLLAMY